MLAWVLAVGAGCSASEPAPSGSTPDALADAGSCGFAVGDRLCELSLVGHVRNATTGLATSEPEAVFGFRDVFAKATQKYVFVHTSAFW